MARQITFEFDLGESVRIREINRQGVVKSLLVDSIGAQYCVHYWDNSSRESTWLFAEELEKVGGN